MVEFLPAEFHAVPYGQIGQAACAPNIPDPNYIGISIRAPSQVSVAGEEAVVLPICAYYQLPTYPLIAGARQMIHVRSLSRPDFLPQSVPVLARDMEDELLVPNPRDKEPIDPRDYKGRVSSSYFYLDAQRYLPQPLEPGTYEVCVTYGEAQSNVVRVEIVER